jgi:hypothetical protein
MDGAKNEQRDCCSGQEAELYRPTCAEDMQVKRDHHKICACETFDEAADGRRAVGLITI